MADGELKKIKFCIYPLTALPPPSLSSSELGERDVGDGKGNVLEARKGGRHGPGNAASKVSGSGSLLCLLVAAAVLLI
jgi:hypothetical protein